jgi:primosomal protein N' (replication factor Y) (superfamily II helicase)
LVKGKPEKPHILNKDQEVIYDSIERAKLKTTHLIHGVTGSGKTEIYLQLAASALKSGKGSIILVPEISLTPQTLSRFEKRFGDKVAVWHSQLKETEKYQTWEKIRSGEKMIVLGARSAIFMPIKNLAYIIIDEEHENSYKQDQSPNMMPSR